MTRRGLAFLIYGVPGIGKTHFSLFFPGPVICFSIYEPGGYAELKQVSDDFSHDVPEDCMGFDISDYLTLKNCLDQVIQQPHYKTVVIDSLSGFQQIFFEYLIKTNVPQTSSQTYKEAEQSFWAFYRGPRIEAVNAIAPFLAVLNSLLLKGVNVILIGHRKTLTEENISGPDVRKAEVDMDEGLRNTFIKWAPNVLYMDMQPTPTEVLDTIGSGQNKTASLVKSAYTSNKMIFTTTNPQNSAKNKLKLPPIIPIGDSAQSTFNNFWQCIKTAS